MRHRSVLRLTDTMTTTTAATNGYLLDNAGDQVPARWAALAAMFDEPTFRTLRGVGIRPGWDCLEIGAGGGSVARWIAEQVGPQGVVTATDLDIRWLEQQQLPNLNAVRHDITRDRLPVYAYHLAHCRLVLSHLRDPGAVIGRLIPALRPGGWLVLEEFDLSYLDGACPRPRTAAEHRANRIREAFTHLLVQRGSDLALPSRLPGLLSARGFEAVEIRGSFESGPAARQLERANLEQVRDDLIAHGITAEELDAHLTELPRLPLLTPMMVSVVARKWPS